MAEPARPDARQRGTSGILRAPEHGRTPRRYAMATGPSTTADDLADNIRATVNRMVDAEFTKQLARRGREVTAALAERAQEMGEAAAEATDARHRRGGCGGTGQPRADRDGRPASRGSAPRGAALGRFLPWPDHRCD